MQFLYHALGWLLVSLVFVGILFIMVWPLPPGDVGRRAIRNAFSRGYSEDEIVEMSGYSRRAIRKTLLS